ncbi:hypothetical protein [Luethyella okanaganae]|uniref:Uncharacterized protein n=1 Tax=Luethyella okanaganae TaxID=69372 RepID=A0ABW1VCZ1_9MICO
MMQGYVVLRISYRMLMNDRAKVEAGILELVRRDEYLWSSNPGWRHGRAAQNAG